MTDKQTDRQWHGTFDDTGR